MKTIYVDNNATTCVAPEVIDAMLPFFKEMWGNPSSMHTFGGQVEKYVDKAREQVAALINADPNEIVFTSCGTESDNTAIHSVLLASPSKKHIITTSVEHPAVFNLCKTLEKEGYEVTFLPVDGQGHLDIENLKSKIRKDTAIVSIMWANNETGVIFPVKEIALICAEKNVPLHVDAVQAAGKIEINMAEVPVTYLALSGHKLHAPKGVGVLYIRKGTPFHPWLLGGHQEAGRRGGTENVASIVGMGLACELAQKNMEEEAKKLAQLRDLLEKGIIDSIPKSYVNGDPRIRLPNTTNISFEGIEGEAILLLLNEYGICASSGSACTTGSLEPSHVLVAMGVPFERAHGSIRFSLSRYNTREEILFILEKLPGIVERLRSLSPVS